MLHVTVHLYADWFPYCHPIALHWEIHHGPELPADPQHRWHHHHQHMVTGSQVQWGGHKEADQHECQWEFGLVIVILFVRLLLLSAQISSCVLIENIIILYNRIISYRSGVYIDAWLMFLIRPFAGCISTRIVTVITGGFISAANTNIINITDMVAISTAIIKSRLNLCPAFPSEFTGRSNPWNCVIIVINSHESSQISGKEHDRA